MSRRTRGGSAVLALVGLLSTSAFAGVTALHVDLEHEHSHGSDPLDPGDHHLAVAASGAHEPGPSTEGQAHPAESPAHEHTLALVANLEHRQGRARTTFARTGHAAGTAPFVLDAPSDVPARISRAGPGEQAAPLSRLSVVLQV